MLPTNPVFRSFIDCWLNKREYYKPSGQPMLIYKQYTIHIINLYTRMYVYLPICRNNMPIYWSALHFIASKFILYHFMFKSFKKIYFEIFLDTPPVITIICLTADNIIRGNVLFWLCMYALIYLYLVSVTFTIYVFHLLFFF